MEVIKQYIICTMTKKQQLGRGGGDVAQMKAETLLPIEARPSGELTDRGPAMWQWQWLAASVRVSGQRSSLIHED